MNFNPEKPFGVVGGVCDIEPRARYQQGPYLYDAHRKCLNASKVPKPPEANTVQDATEELRKHAAQVADKALLKLQRAKAAAEKDPSPTTKRQYKAALKKYEEVQVKLEKLTG